MVGRGREQRREVTKGSVDEGVARFKPEDGRAEEKE